MEVRRTIGVATNMNCHLAWWPEYRRNVFTGQGADRLQALLHEIAAQYRFEILACEVMSNHVQ